MNAEVKEKWIAALKSGEYQQGRKSLRTNDNKFCCLGVLCDIVDPEAWHEGNGLAASNWHHNGASAYPTDKILDELGIESYLARRVANFNDDGQDFEYIADYIERWL